MTIQDNISGFFWQGEQGSGSLASALPFPGSLLSPFSGRRVHIHTLPDTVNHTILTHAPSLTLLGTQPSCALPSNPASSFLRSPPSVFAHAFPADRNLWICLPLIPVLGACRLGPHTASSGLTAVSLRSGLCPVVSGPGVSDSLTDWWFRDRFRFY